MCGYFGTVLTLLYDQEVVDELVDYLISAFELSDDIKIFCLQQFLPKMRNATEDIELPSDEFFKLEGNLLSTGIKLIYAFLWQVDLSQCTGLKIEKNSAIKKSCTSNFLKG